MLKKFFQPNKSAFLFLILLTVLVKGIVWAFVVPIWHFPDEQAHFAQISAYVETGRMPPQPERKDLSREILISEQLLGTERDWAGINKFTYHPEYNLEYTENTIGKYEVEIANLPYQSRRIMEKQEAASYPPLYYLASAVPYQLAYTADLFTRVVVVRVFNLLFFLLLVVVSHRLFRLVFPGDELLVLTATLLVAFHPMLTFVSSGINSDNLFNLLFALGIYYSLAVLGKKLSLRDAIVLTVVLFLGLKTKPQGRLLLYVYLFPIIWQTWRGKLEVRYLLGGLLFLVWLGRKTLVAIYQGKQFIPEVNLYNPILTDYNFLFHLQQTVKHTIAEVIPWYWGVFKWLGVVLPRLINRIINRIMLVSVVGLVVYIIRSLRKRDFSKSLVFTFLLYVAGGYFLAITVFDYFFSRSHGFSIGVQGRYFFPVLPVHMVLMLWGLTSLVPKTFIPFMANLAGIGMVVLNGIAFYIVSSSYYNVSNLSLFFLQASQYKPWFAKSPYLEAWFILYLLVGIFLVYQYLRFPKRAHEKN